MQQVKIAPSILSADFASLGNEVKAVTEAGADYIHIDVMDGHFVPNITYGPLIVDAVNRSTHLPLDTHLMICHPAKYIEQFINMGSDIITVHQEACPHLHNDLKLIKSKGAKCGVSLNPATPLSIIEPVFEMLDLLLIMTVNPGFGGQTFIDLTLKKIREARSYIRKHNLKTLLEIDGGVSPKNSQLVIDAGVDIIVAGSAVFKSDNYKQVIDAMKHGNNT